MLTATDAINQLRLAKFFLNGRREKHSKGQIILDPDDDLRDIYLIRSGYVKVYSIEKDGSKKIYVIYRPRDLFPLLATFDVPYAGVYFEAMSDVKLLKVPAQSFLDFIEAQPHVTLYLFHRLMKGLAIYADRVGSLQHTDSYSRVAHNVLWLVKHLGESIDGGTRYVAKAPITHQTIAELTNVSRETASRQLKKMSDRDLVIYDTDHLETPSITRLQEEIE